MRIDNLQGRQLGRYEITGVLGRGGMAAVYRAIDTVLRRPIALKVLYAHYLVDEAQIERFKREAVVAAGLDHANIVQIYDVGEEGDLVYIAMQLLPGRSLADLLRERGKLTPAELAPILDQIAAALDYAHARGVIHRDIKPANILLDEHNRAVLTDFGIAKSLDAPGLTTTGMMMGTPDYMAPEQIGNQRVDGRVDVYALGILVFRALTGRRPYEGGTDEVLLGHLNGTVPDASMIEPSLPIGIDAVLRTALARRPEDRYQTAGEFAAELRAAVGLPTIGGARRPPLKDVPASQTAPSLNGRVPRENQPTGRAAAIPNTSPSYPRRSQPLTAHPRYEPRNQVVAAEPARRQGPWMFLLIAVLLCAAGGGGFLLAQRARGNSDPGGVIGPIPTNTPTSTLPTPALPAPSETAIDVLSPTPDSAPTLTAVTTPTSAPTNLPEPTSTARPTNTTLPTASPTTTPTASPTTTPTSTPITTPSATPVVVVNGFGLVYANSDVAKRLGSALEPEQGGMGAEQQFENGSMFWYGPAKTVYVLVGTESGMWYEFSNDSQIGPDTPPAEIPELLKPNSSFRDVWTTHVDLQVVLGRPIAAESGMNAAYQPFQKGHMLFSQTGLRNQKTIYVLYQDNPDSFQRFDDKFKDQ